MSWSLNPESLVGIAARDAELVYELSDFEDVIRVTIPPASVDLAVTPRGIDAVPPVSAAPQLPLWAALDMMQNRPALSR